MLNNEQKYLKRIEELAGKIAGLEYNWNKLKEWLETTNTGVGSRKYIFEEILNKMQELESRK